MATNESSALQGKHVYIQNCGFMTGNVVGDSGGSAQYMAPIADSAGNLLGAVVPADGAELVEMTFTHTSPATVTTSGEHEFSISDGTNVLATLASTSATTASGTVTSLVMGTATNGKNLGTTAGSRLTLTNTELGTIANGMHGIFRLVWAL